MRSPLRLLLLPLLAAIAVALTACGSDDDAATTAGGSAAGGTGTSGSAAGAFPVTIESRLGSAEIEAAPERVVALDFSSADAAIALGVELVGMARVDYAEGGIQPWTKALLRGAEPELFSTADGYPVEQIAALRPDVLLAANPYRIADVYDELAQIAPVVTYETAEGHDTWQRSTERIGQALGRTSAAQQLIEQTEQEVADARRAHPQFDGKTISLFNMVDRTAWVISDAEDFSVRFLADLGMTLSPTVARLRSAEGRAQVSPERYDLLDADVVIATAFDPRELEGLEDHGVFGKLDAVRRSAYVALPLSPATSIAFPSAVSVRYALSEIVPQVDRAVG
ncbi:iron-siderophore ABC transporter substrate-binding protein [Conexibacter woesei]|uniref:Periplasmic binding protein n=1 Tax=Conexibacter woesei (strain DSM 14684 / CCUG 47730 / CIP 108061 / JCM 11494 / NBRC 100937 / ID131577) TaxID=469383 RepID=D3F632_CONWI|nr:iron-siderophore ABC transporter substrate-binding protein [Conexibacter woesei]ADB48705.1 periplasmic binding protein [Conexibacter woesei DSM 14684]